MKKSRERLCLEKIMQMLCENKRIQLDPDFSRPYTLQVIDLKDDGETPESGYHTHSSYYVDWEDKVLSDEQMDGVIESLCNHIIGDKGGLSFI